MGIDGLLKDGQKNFPFAFYQVKKKKDWNLVDGKYLKPLVTKDVEYLYIDFNSKIHQISRKLSMKKKKPGKEREMKEDELEEEIETEKEEDKEIEVEEVEEKESSNIKKKIEAMNQIEMKELDENIMKGILFECKKVLTSMIKKYQPKKMVFIVKTIFITF